jgi:hypothetical protein
MAAGLTEACLHADQAPSACLLASPGDQGRTYALRPGPGRDHEAGQLACLRVDPLLVTRAHRPHDDVHGHDRVCPPRTRQPDFRAGR